MYAKPPHARRLIVGCFTLLHVAAAADAQGLQVVGPGGHATIQQAIDAAASGDVVLVHAGVYPSFNVGKPLTITAAPSALVQVRTTESLVVSVPLGGRAHLAGLDVEASSVQVQGDGMTSLERCTIRTVRGTRAHGGVVLMRWSSASAERASGFTAVDTTVHALESTFTTTAGGVMTIEHGGFQALGASVSQLAGCTCVGAWPAKTGAPWPSVGLHVSLAGPTARTYAVDSSIRGGFTAGAVLGPSMVARQSGNAQLWVDRNNVFGYAIGVIAGAPLVGTRTPFDMTIGATFTTTLRSQPGRPMLFYAGLDVAGPVQIPEVVQPAFAFVHTVIWPVAYANALGEADFSFSVPNNPALRHSVLWWRGLDLVVVPWQASTVFTTIVQ